MAWRSVGTVSLGGIIALELVAGAWFVACVGEDPGSDTTLVDASTTDTSPGPTNDTGHDPSSDGGADAPVTPPRCKVDGEFGVPEPIPGMNGEFNAFTGRAAGPRFYFSSDRHMPVAPGITNPATDIFQGSLSADGVISSLDRLGEISSATDEDVSPTESANGLTLYFSGGPTLFDRRLKYVTRQSTDVRYAASDLKMVPLLVAGALYESDPYIVGNQLYFTAASPNNDAGILGGIWVVTINAGGPVANTLQKVPGQFPADTEMRFPVLNKLQTEMYFAISSAGFFKTYVVKRATTEVPFGQPIELPVLAVTPTMLPTSLSDDECDLYLTARDTGFLRLYRSRRPPP